MAASKKDTHLYNARTHNLTSGKELSSASTLAFTSTLSSLIANSSSSASKPTKRKKAGKDDIFSTHNRNTAKRAKRDLDPNIVGPFAQKHSTSGEELGKDVWARSKRKMEEKARLYAAMKRGDVEDVDEKYAVDFDAKWAAGQDDRSSSEDDGEEDDGEEVEYLDEFGRTRKGTKLDALRAQNASTTKDDDRFTARPVAPKSGIIYGDAIQHEAFDPDAPRLAQMAALAEKRDRSLTPPPEEHYDGAKEVRTRGTGFMQFSGDGEERREQMAGLEGLRAETERARAKKVDERRKLVEERRREIQMRGAKRKAEEFLGELGGAQVAPQEDVEEGEEERPMGGSTETEMTERIAAAVRRETEEEDTSGG